MVVAEIGAIIENVLDFGEIRMGFRRMLKPIVFDLFDFKRAVAGKTRKPSNGIAFLDPEFKPGKLVAFFDVKTFPSEAFLACAALKTLF